MGYLKETLEEIGDKELVARRIEGGHSLSSEKSFDIHDRVAALFVAGYGDPRFTV